MKHPNLYLRQNIQLEPLIDQWYAWSHLISPATAARNITERHMKIMDSYISAPMVHASAVRNPRMLGGPFIDYSGSHVDQIRALRERTARDRSDMFELSAALHTLDHNLRLEARGASLHPLYKQIPAILRGYIELVYDANNHASFRLFEPLLYRSRYYNRSAQSLMLSEITGDDRPFVLSTPRLETNKCLHLRVPFDDDRIDQLFRLKTASRKWSDIAGLFDLDSQQAELFRSFFTENAPPAYQPYQGPGLRWRYFGHACILVETPGATLMFDPILSYTYDSTVSRYTYADLPDVIDYAVITHNHQDHILFETLLQLRHRIKHIVVPRDGGGTLLDPSLKLMLESCGFRNVIELREFDEIQLERGGTLVAVPFLGEHGDLDVASKMAYLVALNSQMQLLFAADSCNIEPKLYELLHDQFGDVAVLFLGMECDGAPMSWLYGPLLIQGVERGVDDSRRLNGSNYEQGWAMVNALGCREVYVYAMGQEPWLKYMTSITYTPESRPIVESTRLIENCHARGIVAERLFGEKEILVEWAQSAAHPVLA